MRTLRFLSNLRLIMLTGMLILVSPLALSSSLGQTLPDTAASASGSSRQIHKIRMDVFVRGDLPAAEQVRSFTQDLSQREPGLQIVVHDVLTDRQQLARLHQLTKQFGREKAVVPAFYCCQRMYFGFKDATSSGPKIEELFTFEVYSRDTCPRCQAAKRFLRELHGSWPAIRWRFNDVTFDAAARARWEKLCRGAGAVPGLPTFDFGKKLIIGYQGDEISGAALVQMLKSFAGSADAGEQPSTEDTTQRRPVVSTYRLVSHISSPRSFARVMGNQNSAASTGSSAAELHSPDDMLELPEEADETEIGEGEVLQSEATQPPEESIRVPVFGRLRVGELGLPLFSLAVGLIDGFNPCAMWVLVFLLSVLVNIKDRRKILAIAGTFVVISGVAYFAFMAAWLNLFLLIGMARPVQIALGCLAVLIGVINVKDFFAFKRGISLSIPESSKPGLYRRVRQIVNAKYLSIAIVGAVSLAIVVNLIEFLCTAGLPALYTQILTAQGLPSWQNYLYLAIYIGAYMADDTLLLTVVVATLSHRRLQEREGRWLKLISGVVILTLGAILIFRPQWLELSSGAVLGGTS